MIWKLLNANKKHLTPQQYRTIKGQILAGDVDGAIKGMNRCVRRNLCRNESK